MTTLANFVISGLHPYSKYKMTLSVCTEVGCVESDEVEYWTSQAAPTGQSILHQIGCVHF